MTVKTKEKRDQILKAAEELFASRRYDEITMDEIAQLAQVGKGTLYRYFSSKEALLYAILQTGHEDLVASIRAAAMKKGSFQEILTGVCRQIAVSHERRHPMFHMAFMLNRRTQNDSPELARRFVRRRAGELYSESDAWRRAFERGCRPTAFVGGTGRFVLPWDHEVIRNHNYIG